MALPATISSVAFPGVKNNRLGPFYFSSDDDLYLLLVDGSDNTQLEMHKSSDDGDTWAAQGTNPDTGTNQIMSVWGVVDGTTIHVAVQEAGGDLSYFPYNTSTDAWGTLEHGIQTPTTDDERCSIAVRSDGDIIIVYQGPHSTVKGTNYQRIYYTVFEGSSWSTGTQVDDGGNVHYRGCSIVMGASDKAHIFYEDDTNANIVHKSLTSGNSLSSAENCNDNATSGTEDNVGAAVYYDAAGTERITVSWRRSSDAKAYSAEIDNDGTPSAEEAISDASLDTATTIPPFLTVGDGDIVYAHFTNTDRDIYHDENDNSGGWGTDVETLDAVTVEYLYGNTFIRSGATIFGYLYDDSGTVKYNEYELIAGGGITVTPAAASAAGDTVAPTTILGSITIDNPLAAAAGDTVNPTVILGAITISNPLAVAVGATVAPTVVLGSTVASNPIAAAAGGSVAPTTILGSQTITGLLAAAVGDTVNPTVINNTLLTPDPAAAVGDTVNPTTILGPVVIANAIASAAGAIVVPTVVLGSTIVSNAIASAAGDTVAPTVVLGSQTISGLIAAAVGDTIAPTIINNVLLTPSAASAAGDTVDPTVDAGGSETVTPSAASAAGDTVAPTTILGPITIVNPIASAVASTLSGTVLYNTPSGIIFIMAQDRTHNTAAEDRIVNIADEDRSANISAEDRAVNVPAMSRTIQVD